MKFYYVLKYTVESLLKTVLYFTLFIVFFEQSGHYLCNLLEITAISCSNEAETSIYTALYSFIAFFHLCVLVTVGNQQPESVCMYHNI